MKKGKILKLFAVIFLSVMLIILGCAGGKKLARPFSGEPESGLTFSYSLNPGIPYHYALQTDIVQNLEMQGRSMQTNIFSAVGFTARGKEKSNNDLIIEIKIDSIYSLIKGMAGSQELDLYPLMKKPFELVLSPNGKELEFRGNDSLQVDVGPMAGGVIGVERFFQQVFPDIPENSIKIGQTWTENAVDTTKQGGMDVVSDLEMEHTFKGVDIMNGMECLIITTSAEGTLDGHGEQMGNSIAMEGNIELESTCYFAYKKGIFIKSESKSFIEGTLAVTGGMSMTLPMTMETESSVQLD